MVCSLSARCPCDVPRKLLEASRDLGVDTLGGCLGSLHLFGILGIEPTANPTNEEEPKLLADGKDKRTSPELKAQTVCAASPP